MTEDSRYSRTAKSLEKGMSNVLDLGSWILDLGSWNLELGTWNLEHYNI